MFLKEEESDANKKSKMSKIEELLQKCPLEKREDLMGKSTSNPCFAMRRNTYI